MDRGTSSHVVSVVFTETIITRWLAAGSCLDTRSRTIWIGCGKGLCADYYRDVKLQRHPTKCEIHATGTDGGAMFDEDYSYNSLRS